MSEKSVRTSGWNARQYIQSLTPFHNSGSNHRHPKGSTLWGEWMTFADDSDPLYVVYSYGSHWPLYANWKGVWFANKDKASRTTSKHYSQAHPHTGVVALSKIDMEYLVLFGQPEDQHLVEAAKLKLLPDELIPMATAARIGG